LIQIVGFIAGFLTVVSFLPQVIQAWKTKRVKDVSFWMIAILMTAAATWIAYGIMEKDMPVIVTNVASFILQSAIMTAKIKFKNEQE
jgi:MtN3 and saliva related transmembrane protein